MAQDYSFSNCNISNPIIQPGKQTVVFNGFAWSSTGMIHQVVDNTNDQSWETWLATQQ